MIAMTVPQACQGLSQPGLTALRTSLGPESSRNSSLTSSFRNSIPLKSKFTSAKCAQIGFNRKSAKSFTRFESEFISKSSFLVNRSRNISKSRAHPRKPFCSSRIFSSFSSKRPLATPLGSPSSSFGNNAAQLCCNRWTRKQHMTLSPLHATEPRAVSVSQPLEDDYLPDFEIGENGEFTDLDKFLDSNLPTNPNIHRGMLENGLRYVILPNRVPANRFEAHLEMHVGSIDEREHEQGIAHLIEHVTFLGSKKREGLLGFGARSNAYTDFHHTVFHVHSPIYKQGTNDPLIPQVLEALHEIAFCPKFLPTRIEKERRAVLSELQMMNTIEYRIDCQLLQQLHSENLLSCRFPIGLEEQIKGWDIDTIKAFHERWYFPANATLFIVGDIPNVSSVVEMIEAQFSSTPPGLISSPSPSAAPLSSIGTTISHPSTFPPTNLNPISQPFSGPMLQNPTHPSSLSPSSSSPNSSFPPSSLTITPLSTPLPSPSSSPIAAVKKTRHEIRPPVRHKWSSLFVETSPVGFPSAPEEKIIPHIFSHELVQNFSLSVFCKNPVQPVRTFRDLRNVLMQRIFLSTLQFRINGRYKSENCPFLGIDLDHSDSGREGCVVSTLTVNSEPQNWDSAIKVAMQEVRRLKEFGLTRGELHRYLSALLKDSERMAAMIDSIPSLDNLEFIMDSDSLNHAIMNQEQAFQCISAISSTISLEEVNEEGGKLLEFVADFGKRNAPIPAAIVACAPKKFFCPENSGSDIPFEISEQKILDAIKLGLQEPIQPEPEVEVPVSLISDLEAERMKERKPSSFVPLDSSGSEFRRYDKATGIIQKRLSNGIRINMKATKNEAQAAILRLTFPGGRIKEQEGEYGSIAIGIRTLSEGGTVGGFSREQVELFCVSNLINCMLDADEEFICMDMRFSTRDNGIKAAFQLIHMVLEHSVWTEDAFERAKQLYISNYRAIPKSMERLTAHKLTNVMFSGDQRVLEPNPEAINKLNLDVVKNAVLKQMRSGNLELSIVGDFDEKEVDKCILEYLATLSFPEVHEHVKKLNINLEDSIMLNERLIIEPCSDKALRNQKVLLKDTDERACAYIAGSCFNRWGFTSDDNDVNLIVEPLPNNFKEMEEKSKDSSMFSFVKGIFKSFVNQEEEQTKKLASMGIEVLEDSKGQKFLKRRRHPLFASISLSLLAEVMNARLFTTVRDSLGLTYDVSFEVSLFDRLKTGWYVISVTSTPAKIDQAVDACLRVLRGFNTNRITRREVDRAKRTLLMRHEADLKDNAYWLGLITHLQSDFVPRKDVGCIRDLHMYEIATPEDLHAVYDFLATDQARVFTCIGVSGASVLGGSHAADLLSEGLSEDDTQLRSVPEPPMLGRGKSTVTRPTT